MSKNEDFCRRILKTYNFMVDFEGDIEVVNVKAPIENETFKGWKERVLGTSVSKVTVYKTYEPNGNTKLKTLQDYSGGAHLKEIFKTFGEMKDNKKSEAIDRVEQVNAEAIECVEQLNARDASTKAKDVLSHILYDPKSNLKNSVKDLLNRYYENNSGNINIDALIRELVENFNFAVKTYREFEAKQEAVEAKVTVPS